MTARFREIHQRWYRRIADLLTQGVQAGEFGDINIPIGASLILAVVNGVEMESNLDVGPVIDAKFVNEMKKGILMGLKNGTNQVVKGVTNE